METWYRAKFGEIKEVNVVKETAEYVFLDNGARTIKYSDWQWFSKDREKAKRMMVRQYEGNLQELKKKIKVAEERLLKAMEA